MRAARFIPARHRFFLWFFGPAAMAPGFGPVAHGREFVEELRMYCMGEEL